MIRILCAVLVVVLASCGGGSTEQPIPAQQYAFNSYNQLISDTSKTEVPCPAQTAATIVAFAFGQSNSASHSDHMTTATSPKIVNYYNGKCYAAADPLLGATGTGGSQWVAMANKIADRYDTIVLIADGIAGTSIAQWVGGLNPQFVTAMDQAQSQYIVTHFLWHQGEADAHWTSGADYSADLTQIIGQTRQIFPTSKFYVSVATYCHTALSIDPAIQDAQRSVVNHAANVFQGPNTDQWTGFAYRWDDCHFNGSAIDLVSDAWASLL